MGKDDEFIKSPERELSKDEWTFYESMMEESFEDEKNTDILEKDWEQREIEEEKRNKLTEELIHQKLSLEEKEEIKEKVEQVKRLYAYDKFRRLFNKVSFCNEILGQAVFHMILGTLISHFKILKSSGRYVDFRVPVLSLQDSGSGKSEAGNLVDIIFKKIGRKIIEYDDKKDEFKYQTLRLNRHDSQTDASLLDDYATDINGRYTNRVLPGVLSTNDYIFYEEAVELLLPGRFNEKLQRIFINILEPIGRNEYIRSLKGYPRPLPTHSVANVFAITRTIEKVRTDLLYSGLLQRFLFIPRNIDIETRKKMNSLVALSSIRQEDDDFDKVIEDIAKEFMMICEFAHKNWIGFSPENTNNLLAYLNEKMKFFSEETSNITDFQFRSILFSVTARYRDMILKIAHHSALMRMNRFVDLVDLEYAFNLVEQSYKLTRIWIEDCVLKDKEIEIKEYYRSKIIKNILLKNNGIVERKKLVELVSKACKVHQSSAYVIIRKECEGESSMLIEEGRFIKIR